MRIGLALMVGDGFLAAGNYFVWLIALFTVRDGSYAAVGGAAALAALAAAVGPLTLAPALALYLLLARYHASKS